MFLRTLLGAVVVLLVCTGSARASSLVYVKDSNVWLANPDGTAARQLTTDGFKESPYESPSQADDGTILARRGLRFVKLDRRGRPLGPPLPSILVGKPANALAVGPFDPKLSPDGKTLVYWIGTWSTWFDYGTSTNWTDPQDAVIWQDAGSGAQLGFTMFYGKPSWLQDSRHALLNQADNRLTAQIVNSAIGASHNGVTHFFTDNDSKPAGEYYTQDVGDAELTPAGDKLVALRGPNAETIRFYDTRSGRPRISACGLGEPVGGSAADPTWAPDGSAVAWTEGDGIWTTPVGALDSTDCTWEQPHRIIAGASQPDWGPADVSAAPAEAPGSAPRRTNTRRRTLVVRAPASIKRTVLLRSGLKVRITAARDGRATAALRLTRRTVARRSRRLAAGRTTVLVLKPSRQQASRVRHARALKLAVRKGRHVFAQRLALQR
jgi:hypothetical protein